MELKPTCAFRSPLGASHAEENVDPRWRCDRKIDMHFDVPGRVDRTAVPFAGAAEHKSREVWVEGAGSSHAQDPPRAIRHHGDSETWAHLPDRLLRVVRRSFAKRALNGLRDLFRSPRFLPVEVINVRPGVRRAEGSLQWVRGWAQQDDYRRDREEHEHDHGRTRRPHRPRLFPRLASQEFDLATR